MAGKNFEQAESSESVNARRVLALPALARARFFSVWSLSCQRG
jgi:hypothetical protein